MSIPGDRWDPAQYERFKRERDQPFFDLLALVQRSPDPGARVRVVDLGCGSGELTARMHEQLGGASTLGLDSSPAMLAQAARWAVDGLTFAPGDIAYFAANEAYDLVFSNAALQWVDDHPGRLAAFARALRPAGQLAIQLPAQQDQPTHRLAQAIAAEPRFQPHLAGFVPQAGVLEPEAYARNLHRLGFSEQIVRLQVYTHVLERKSATVEWLRGSLFTAYQSRLPEPLFAEFLDAYRERLLAGAEDEAPYPFTYRRLFLWARRP